MGTRAKSSSLTTEKKMLRAAVSKAGAFVAAGSGVGAGIVLASQAAPANANDAVVNPGTFKWSHGGFLDSFDTASVRRGLQVYRQVCSACHSLEALAFRNLIGVTHPLEEAKLIAESYQITDGPDDNGEMFERPGKVSDKMPLAYPNEEAAKAANAGANPPDLSLITKARHDGQNYVFSLLTGFVDPPAGVEVRDGLHYNPYFPGHVIGMARPLYDDAIEYDDGTKASTSQMAKDVVTFLSWIGEPWHDGRKRIGIKAMFLTGCLAVLTLYTKRVRWSVLKSRKIYLDPK